MRNKIKELQIRTRNSGLENQKQKNENHFSLSLSINIQYCQAGNQKLYINKIKSEMRNKIKELQVRPRNSGLENQKQKNENQIQK